MPLRSLGPKLAPVASTGLSGVLAVEVSVSWRPTVGLQGSSGSDPRYELDEPTLGRPAYPWGASQARNRGWPDDRGEIYGSAPSAPIAGLEDIPSQSRGRIASIDLVIAPTIAFRLLYGLVILRHGRRQLLSINVTNHPTAEWIARQITDAFAWDSAPRYLVRDRDGAYGRAFTRRLLAMGIRDHPVAPRSPWQNGYVERLIGSIRRECLDHMIVFGEQHLRHILKSYATYYNEVRTHCHCGKIRPLPAPCSGPAASSLCPILRGCITNMSAFEFPVGTGAMVESW